MARPSEKSSHQFIRVIVADSQAIFRAGLRKIFALENDIRIVGQAETFEQALSAVNKFVAEILIFEAALAERPVEALQEILQEAPGLRVIVVTEAPHRELTLDLFRHGAQSIVSREVDSGLFIAGLRKVAQGEPWLEPHAATWVFEAYRAQTTRHASVPPNVHLTRREALIASCVTQGMTNKEIAVRIGTTEQVVKNYLRRVYSKIGVADRLELALYFLSDAVFPDLGQSPTTISPTEKPTRPERPKPQSPRIEKSSEG